MGTVLGSFAPGNTTKDPVGDVLIGLELLKLAFSALGSSALVDRCQALNIREVVQEEGRVDVL